MNELLSSGMRWKVAFSERGSTAVTNSNQLQESNNGTYSCLAVQEAREKEKRGCKSSNKPMQKKEVPLLSLRIMKKRNPKANFTNQITDAAGPNAQILVPLAR
jgi:hypothetical protein